MCQSRWCKLAGNVTTLTSLFNYHWSSSTQWDQESLDPDGTCSSRCLQLPPENLFFLEQLPKEQKRKTEFPQGTLKETYKDFLDRWSLKLITSICGLQVQTNACMASQWAEIIISQWGHYWQQEDPSAETPDTPHWTKTPVWGNLHDLLWRYPWKYYSVSSTCIHLI